MKRPRLRVWVGGTVLGAVAVGWIWWTSDWSPWFSAPDRVRPDETWDVYFENPPKLGAGPEFAEVDIIPSADVVDRFEFHIDPRRWNSADHRLPFVQVKANEHGVAELPCGGTIRLTSAEIADLALKPRPQVRVKVELSDDVPEIGWHMSNLFDARTHAWAVSDEPYRHPSPPTVFEIDAAIWHDTQFLLTLDLNLGPPVEFHIPLGQSSQFVVDNAFRIQLLNLFPGRFERYKAHSRRTGVGYGFITQSEGDSAAALCFDPPGYGDLVRVAADGIHFKSLESHATGKVHIARFFDTDISEVEALRGRYLPNLVRVIFPIDHLSGMPNPRDEVDNLFEIVIPFATVNQSADLQRLIERSTQTSMIGNSSPAFPDGYFPHTFTDISPQQLLAEWEHYTIGPPIETRPDDFLIVRDAKQPWRDRIRVWWNGLWN